MDRKKIYKYALLFVVLILASFVGFKIRKYYQDGEEDDEYKLIRKFLLNDAQNSSLQEQKKPKLWIHTTYGMNARKWKSFYSRNSTELNQPYLHLTIQSIVQHCSDSFHVCLIDDESFSQLIPAWSISLSTFAEPIKHRLREYGLSTLLYMYGGMIIPNSFICFQDLIGLYQDGMGIKEQPFVCERINRTESIQRNKKRLTFVPDSYVMGCKSGDPVMGQYMEHWRSYVGQSHFQSQSEFTGESSEWLLQRIESGEINLLDGTNVGVKTKERTKILLEELMEEAPLDLVPGCYGIYIPADEVLSRIKYQWLANLSEDELLQSSPILAKYFKLALTSAPSTGIDPVTGMIAAEVEVVEIKGTYGSFKTSLKQRGHLTTFGAP